MTNWWSVGCSVSQALVWVPLLGQVRELASTHPEALIRQVAQDVAARLPALATADFDRWRALRESPPGPVDPAGVDGGRGPSAGAAVDRG